MCAICHVSLKNYVLLQHHIIFLFLIFVSYCIIEGNIHPGIGGSGSGGIRLNIIGEWIYEEGGSGESTEYD